MFGAQSNMEGTCGVVVSWVGDDHILVKPITTVDCGPMVVHTPDEAADLCRKIVREALTTKPNEAAMERLKTWEQELASSDGRGEAAQSDGRTKS